MKPVEIQTLQIGAYCRLVNYPGEVLRLSWKTKSGSVGVRQAFLQEVVTGQKFVDWVGPFSLPGITMCTEVVDDIDFLNGRRADHPHAAV